MDVKIPGKLYNVLRDRDALRDAPDVAAEQRGNRVTLTGPREQLAELGSYIDGLADLVVDRILPGYELGGYSVAKLREIASRFPALAEPSNNDMDNPEIAALVHSVTEDGCERTRFYFDDLAGEPYMSLEHAERDARERLSRTEATAVTIDVRGRAYKFLSRRDLEQRNDVTIPSALYDALAERGMTARFPGVDAEQRDGHTTLRGSREQLAALGAYIADCAVFAASFRTYTLGGYLADQLREFAARFPAEREQVAASSGEYAGYISRVGSRWEAHAHGYGKLGRDYASREAARAALLATRAELCDLDTYPF